MKNPTLPKILKNPIYHPKLVNLICHQVSCTSNMIQNELSIKNKAPMTCGSQYNKYKIISFSTCKMPTIGPIPKTIVPINCNTLAAYPNSCISPFPTHLHFSCLLSMGNFMSIK
eukprot:NODE_648_length_5041_cov_0.519021.p6 type:complete len:114 gc:universal NODE_648_length_5041_cov_0.519021:4677-4336(-)